MTEEKRTFEERLQSVQEITARIEEGKLSLEDSVKEFEEGMKTLTGLEEELKDLSRRLTMLQGGKEEELVPESEGMEKEGSPAGWTG